VWSLDEERRLRCDQRINDRVEAPQRCRRVGVAGRLEGGNVVEVGACWEADGEDCEIAKES
jgi:hypothetical protein